MAAGRGVVYVRTPFGYFFLVVFIYDARIKLVKKRNIVLNEIVN